MSDCAEAVSSDSFRLQYCESADAVPPDSLDNFTSLDSLAPGVPVSDWFIEGVLYELAGVLCTDQAVLYEMFVVSVSDEVVEQFLS